MLDELTVRNLGIIATARLVPGPGLVVVSGETGAGKTLLLGALRLLCGETARPDLIGPEGDETTVEARLLPGDDEVTATRQVLRGGRSRAYLDGSPVPARVLAERVGTLVEIVGQHDHQALSRPTEVRALVDRLLDDEGLRARDDYRAAWERAQSLSRESEASGWWEGGTAARRGVGPVPGRRDSRCRVHRRGRRGSGAHAWSATSSRGVDREDRRRPRRRHGGWRHHRGGRCGDETSLHPRLFARATGKARRGVPGGDGRSHRRVARRRRRSRRRPHAIGGVGGAAGPAQLAAAQVRRHPRSGPPLRRGSHVTGGEDGAVAHQSGGDRRSVG